MAFMARASYIANLPPPYYDAEMTTELRQEERLEEKEEEKKTSKELVAEKIPKEAGKGTTEREISEC